jgi:hypothetical protein
MLTSLNEINEEHLAHIEELGKHFFTPREIATMLEIDQTTMTDAMNDIETSIYRSYNKGFLQSEYELRKCILQLALSGSSPAQAMAKDIKDKATIKKLDR